MNHGGKRENSGRRDGSQNVPKFSSYFTEKEVEEFVRDLFIRAKTSDKIAVFVGEHLFGKAIQPIGGEDGKPIMISFDKSFSE